MKKHGVILMFGFVKEVLFTFGGFDGSISAKWLSLNNQLCLRRLTLTDLNFDEELPGLPLAHLWLI